MSKKKKTTRGNPAVSNALSGQKPRGGWKPSTSVGSSTMVSRAPQRRRRLDWKKVLIILGAIILSGVFIVTTVLSTVPIFPEAPAPYNAPNVVQGQ